MTKASYKPNIIIYYKADQMMPFMGGKENRINFDNIMFDITFNHYNPYLTPGNIIFVNESFDNGVGKIELYVKPAYADNYIMLPFSPILEEYPDFIYLFGTINDNDCIYELRIEGAYVLNISNMKNLYKVILPENTQYLTGARNSGFNSLGVGYDTNLSKLIIPPNIKTYNEWGDEFKDGYRFINKNNENIELIFTSYEVPKFAYHKNDVIKCPPNLVDKYKEYYPNAIPANNIIVTKIIKENDRVIKFTSSKDADQHLYITSRDVDENIEEYLIICYDDIITDALPITHENNNGGGSWRPMITEVIFPNSLETVTGHFFSDNVKKVTIPENVKSISYLGELRISKENLINLSDVVISSTTHIYDDSYDNDNFIMSNDNETLHYIRSGHFVNNNYLTIPDGVVKLADKDITSYETYNNCKNIILYVPASLTDSTIRRLFNNECIYTSITVHPDNPNYYSDCNTIIEKSTNKMVVIGQNFSIPDNVTIIQNGLFNSKRWVLEYILTNELNLNKVTTIEQYAFNMYCYMCGKVKYLHITKYITKLYGNSFTYTYTNKFDFRITVDKENTTYTDYNGSNVVVEIATNKLILLCGNIIPEGVTIISNYCKCFNSDHTQLFIPSSVTTIEDKPFYHFPYNEIVYNGTIEDWDNITKPTTWYTQYRDRGAKTCKVICTNGELEITL